MKAERVQCAKSNQSIQNGQILSTSKIGNALILTIFKCQTYLYLGNYLVQSVFCFCRTFVMIFLKICKKSFSYSEDLLTSAKFNLQIDQQNAPSS